MQGDTPPALANRWGADTFDHYMSLYQSAEAPAAGGCRRLSSRLAVGQVLGWGGAVHWCSSFRHPLALYCPPTRPPLPLAGTILTSAYQLFKERVPDPEWAAVVPHFRCGWEWGSLRLRLVRQPCCRLLPCQGAAAARSAGRVLSGAPRLAMPAAALQSLVQRGLRCSNTLDPSHTAGT